MPTYELMFVSNSPPPQVPPLKEGRYEGIVLTALVFPESSCKETTKVVTTNHQ